MIGTNTSATRSASCWMGAFEPCACSTRRTIWASAVSRPTFVARKTKEPPRLSVAPMTVSRGPLSTGRLSPVSMLSSSAELPSSITPSTGTFSPGRTRTRSPTSTASIGTSCSAPALITRAVRACKPISAFMAALVWPLARASIQRPSRIRATMMTAVS